MKHAFSWFTCTLIFGLALFAFAAFGGSIPDELQHRGEIYLYFSADQVLVIDDWTGISPDRVHQDILWVYANKKGYETLLAQDIHFNIIPFTHLKSGESYTHYPGYDAYVGRMYAWADSFPELCRIIKVGESVQGRDILFARITAPGNADNAEKGIPAFMYSSTMHGNELSGYVMMLKLIDYLLDEYGTDEQVTWLLDSTDIWINPLANPDGTYFGGNHSVAEATRFNANHIDLNRNFPDVDGTGEPDGNSLQDENQAMITLFESHPFVLSANLHDGAEVLNYPWDRWQEKHPDDSWFVDICRRYADSARARSGGAYLSGFDHGITNGWAWYSVRGSRQDYVNYYQHAREVTFELSQHKIPDSLTLDSLWHLNRPSMLQYMAETHRGIKGRVVDAKTGEPLQAKVAISGHDKHNSQVYSDAQSGWFYRPLLQGTYELKISAAAYEDTLVTITMSRPLQRCIISLRPQHVSPPSFSFRLYPNPAQQSFTISIDYPEEGALLRIVDLQGIVRWQTNVSKASQYQKTISALSAPGLYVVQYLGTAEKKSGLMILLGN